MSGTQINEREQNLIVRAQLFVRTADASYGMLGVGCLRPCNLATVRGQIRAVEYALRDIRKPIGIADWQTKLVESLPKDLEGQLPTIEDLEKELGHEK